MASSAGVELAARRPLWFVVFGLWGVASLLVAGSVLAVALTRCPFGGRLWWMVRLTGWCVSLFLLVRGIAIEALLLTGWFGVRAGVGPEQAHWILLLWNPWFVLGGLSFALASLNCLGRGGTAAGG